MASIEGTCEPRFEGVRAVLEGTLDRGEDVGACACVVVDGEVVVDVWGGAIDEAGTTPWQRDTIINTWSTTKTMTALCALVLLDRGELDLHAPVARYWPEFAAAGKDGVEVRHVLGHTAGLSGWTEPMLPTDLYDWDLCCSRLAAQEPWWEPGAHSGYHAITQGFLVGELVRRVTGVTLGSFFAKEIAGPIGADFHIGTGPEHDDRIALVIPPPPLDALELDPESLAVRTLANPMLDAAQSWEEPWRRAELPAINGHGNARSVAAVQSLISCGGAVGGVRLLSEAGCAAIFEEQANGIDPVLGGPVRLGVGFGLNDPDTSPGAAGRSCYWGGWGGSLVVNDVDQHMTVAYVMNRMGEGTLGDDRGRSVVQAAYAALPR